MNRLADPWMLAWLPAIALAGLWIATRRDKRPRMRVSPALLMAAPRRTLRMRLLTLPVWLTLAACVFVVVALARPQSAWSDRQRFIEGIDIMLAIDCSGSMQAPDFTPNRLEKAKSVVENFIDGRENDRIGVVIFGADTFALCPLTHDYGALKTFVSRINFDLVDSQGTAVGDGLANAVKRLQDSDAPSKVVILLTDGENNAGRIDPATAAGVARKLGVRVYTIGIGGGGRHGRMMTVRTAQGLQRMSANVDTQQLGEIAQTTGGQFFMATNDKSLENIYAEIDQLEKRKVEINETHYFDELGQYFMWPALALLLAGFLLENTWLRTFP